ncbi:hypothetical protein GCM10007922_26610 [Shewanella decolorationis]|nr:hypothetical protein GCM10007922_26610 [Shewanella decolorationis]
MKWLASWSSAYSDYIAGNSVDSNVFDWSGVDGNGIDKSQKNSISYWRSGINASMGICPASARGERS